MNIRICEVHKNPREAIKLAVAQGFTHLLTFNGEGPEPLASLEKMKTLCQENPWSTVAAMDGEEFTGLNIYPLFYLQNFQFYFPEEHFHHEAHAQFSLRNIECLKVSMNGVKRVSVKNLKYKFYEFLLKFFFYFLKELKVKDRPAHSALSFSVGIFIACSPFYGLQTLLIIGLSALLRLNLALALLGSQISLPPLYAMILPAELYVGFQITGHKWSLEGDLLTLAQSHFTAWLVGALVVGGLISLFSGLGWWLMQRSFQQKKAVNWSGKNRGGKWGNEFLSFILKNMGQLAGYAILYLIIPYFYLFAPRARKGMNQYWKILKPKESWLKRQFRALQHLMIFARTLMDRVFQGSREKLYFNIEYDNSQDIQESIEGEHSTLLLFSHFGGWDIAAQKFSDKKLDSKISLLEYEFEGLTTNKITKNKKTSNINKIFVKPNQPIFMKIHEALSDGGNLALMGDRPLDQNIELMPLLGKLAPIPITPFRLAKIYKVDLIFTAGARKDRKTYRLYTEKKSLQGQEVEVMDLAKDYIHFLEKIIQENPYQWFNFYPFWSSLPTLPNGEPCLPERYELRESYSL